MTDFLEVIVVGSTTVIIFAIIFGFILMMRYLSYKERKAIAEANGRFAERDEITEKEPLNE